MKKLLWLSGIASLLTLLQPDQALPLATAAEVTPESTTPETVAPANNDTGDCPAISVLLHSLPEGGSISLVTAFAPADIAPLPSQSCHSQMDPVSRQLFIAVLTQTDRLTDPSHRARAMMHLADTYKTYGQPQTLPLLDYALQQIQTLPDEQLRLNIMAEIAHLHTDFSPEQQTSARADQAMEMAAQLITQLRFGDDSTAAKLGEANTSNHHHAADESPAAIADSSTVYQVAHWYLSQGELTKARTIISHMDNDAQRQSYGEQLEEDYANQLAEQGKLAAASRHRRQYLSPERQAPYAEAAAYEQMISFAETLPGAEDIIDQELLKQLQRNVDKLQVDWAKYTYGQMVARQLILSEQYDAALETLSQAPLPHEPTYSEPAHDELADEVSSLEPEVASSDTGQDSSGTVKPLGFSINPTELSPTLLATELAAEGYGEEALAFINHLPQEHATRDLQRAILLTTVAVFSPPTTAAGPVSLTPGKAYLDEAIALTERLSTPTQQAEMWFFISMAQHWHNDSTAAKTSMEKAIAIAPELDDINQEILTELKEEPWLFQHPKESQGEYNAVQDFYQAMGKDDLAAAETVVMALEEPYLKVSLQGALAAAFSKTEQAPKSAALLTELFELKESEDLAETFGDEGNLFQAIVSHYASAQGRITPLKQVLATLTDAEQQAQLLGMALSHYSYSDNTDVPLPELLLLRDEILKRSDPEEQAYLFKGLLQDIARKGAFSEAIALVEVFSPEEQPLATVAIADVYGEHQQTLTRAMQVQLINQVQTQLIQPES